MKLNMRNGFTVIEMLIVIVIICILVAISVEGNDNTKKRNEQQCAAMFSLANNLTDSVKVAKIDAYCLQYIQAP